MKLVLFLATVFLDTEAAFTSKHYANQKVYSNNTKQNLPNVKSQIACCNRCLSTQDCLGIKHEESTCTLVSNAFPIIESNPTNAEDIFMDQDVVKSYEKYPYSLESSNTVLALRGGQRENSFFLNLETLEICNLDIETSPGPWSPSFHVNFRAGILGNAFPVFCSGKLQPSNVDVDSCTFWGHDSKNSIEIPGREDPAIVQWDFGSIWLTGGYDRAETKPSKKTFIISLDEVKDGPELPFPNSKHCMVQIDDSTYAMIGGDKRKHQLQFYSKKTGLWTTGPSTPSSHAGMFGCTVFELQGSKAIAVVGGKDANQDYSNRVEFYKMDSMTWEEGPDLDEGLIGFALVTGKNGKILYTIGGDPSYGAIRVLDCSIGTCPDAWTRHGGKVDNQVFAGPPGGGFYNGGHVMVPDKMMDQKCP